MKKVIALAAAGMIAATPLVAGNLTDTEVEPEIIVVEEAASSLNGTTGALLGLAALGGIIAVASGT